MPFIATIMEHGAGQDVSVLPVGVAAIVPYNNNPDRSLTKGDPWVAFRMF